MDYWGRGKGYIGPPLKLLGGPAPLPPLPPPPPPPPLPTPMYSIPPLAPLFLRLCIVWVLYFHFLRRLCELVFGFRRSYTHIRNLMYYVSMAFVTFMSSSSVLDSVCLVSKIICSKLVCTFFPSSFFFFFFWPYFRSLSLFLVLLKKPPFFFL